MPGEGRRILIIGGGFAGFVVARHMRKHFDVTLVDAKDYFEYTPGVLRAFVSPSHLAHLTFKYAPVFQGMGVNFIHGEVKSMEDLPGDAPGGKCMVKKVADGTEMFVEFEYVVVACGCNFGLFHKVGESLWFPSVWEKTRAGSDWPHIDERTLEGRQQHVEEECAKLATLNQQQGASVLIVGAGFIGVEWATEIREFFPNIEITLCDMLQKCLGPLPDNAKTYCQTYMDKVGIKTVYGAKYNPFSDEGWKGVAGMTKKPDLIYVSTGFKASCYFMPKQVMTEYNPTKEKEFEDDIKKRGPSGGGWIRTDLKLQARWLLEDGVTSKPYLQDSKGNGRCFAVGDCNMMGDLKPIPKISYPGEEQAAVACRQIDVIESTYYNNKDVGWYTVPKFWPIIPCYGKLEMTDFWWPWGSGMFATSLGVNDACFVIAANSEPGSGYMVVWGRLCSWQKWFIEWSKVDQCKEGWIGWATWVTVH